MFTLTDSETCGQLHKCLMPTFKYQALAFKHQLLMKRRKNAIVVIVKNSQMTYIYKILKFF